MAILELILIAFSIPFITGKSIGSQFYATPNDTQTCVNDLIKWCDGMKYPTEEGTVSIVSIGIFDSTGYCQATCIADSEGTNCTKNGSPWLSCSKENQLFYKGKPLEEDSLSNTDNSTCETADKAFNDLFLQNLNSDNTTVSKELEDILEFFFKSWRSVEQQISDLQRTFSGAFGSFPFYNSYPYPYNPDRPGVVNSEDTDSVEDSREKE